MPEGRSAREAGSRGDQYSIVRDLLDAPAGGAEQNYVAYLALVHHLFVQFADTAAAPRRLGPAEEDRIEAAICDGAAVGDGQTFCALAGAEDAGPAIPGNPGT